MAGKGRSRRIRCPRCKSRATATEYADGEGGFAEVVMYHRLYTDSACGGFALPVKGRPIAIVDTDPDWGGVYVERSILDA